MVDEADLKSEPEVDLQTEEQPEEQPQQPKIDYKVLLTPLEDHMAAPREYERPNTKRKQWRTTIVRNAFGEKKVRELVKVPAQARQDWRPEWLAHQPWLDYWLHRSYGKSLGGVADEHDGWAPDYPLTVQLTVPLLVAIKQRPVTAQLTVSHVFERSQKIMLRRAEVAECEVDERDDPAMRLRYDGTDERFIEYAINSDLTDDYGVNLPREARIARAIFEGKAEDDGSRLVVVAEVGKRLVIRALSSHGDVGSIEGFDKKPKLARPRLREGMRRATKAKKAKAAKQPQLGRHETRLLGLARELAEKGGADLIADWELRATFIASATGANGRRDYLKAVKALQARGFLVKVEEVGVTSYRLVGDGTPNRTYLETNPST